MDRRGFLFGLGALLVTAPAIVNASNLMPVKNYTIQVPRKRLIVAEFDDTTKTIYYKRQDSGQIVDTWIDESLPAYGTSDDLVKQPKNWAIDYYKSVNERFDSNNCNLKLPQIEVWDYKSTWVEKDKRSLCLQQPHRYTSRQLWVQGCVRRDVMKKSPNILSANFAKIMHSELAELTKLGVY